MKYRFSENNSGGSWWLNRKQYDKLIAAGWKYEPTAYEIEHGHDKNPWYHDPRDKDEVPYGWRHNLTLEAASEKIAVAIWETATDANINESGCSCCGSPFDISLVYEDENN